MVILTFGSSIGWGAWDEKGGWAQRLKDLAYEKAKENNFQTYTNVYPLGIDGDNSERLLQRFEPEIKARIYDEKDITIIIGIGSNDSQYLLKENSHWIEPDKFENNLHKLIEISRKYNAKLVFLGLTPVDKRVDPIPWKKEASYKIENTKKYDEIIKKVCASENIPFIEILSKFPQGDINEILVDGVHPNTKGHEIIFEEVKKYLQENNLI